MPVSLNLTTTFAIASGDGLNFTGGADSNYYANQILWRNFQTTQNQIFIQHLLDDYAYSLKCKNANNYNTS